jgi:Fic family protein
MNKPQLPPRFSPDISEIVRALHAPGITPEVNGEYLHWDELRRRTPPEQFDHRGWWTAIQIHRQGLLREFPLTDEAGHPFRFGMPDSVLRLVHSIDRDAAGRIEVADGITNRATRDKYIVSSLIEEAITSSQLEGASTTRRVAKKMLESGRRPQNHDETMIWNNFQAMEWVRSNLHRPLTRDAVLELHRVVTVDALDGGNDGAGRFRRADEPVMVVDHDDNETLHVPPRASSLTERMDAMCSFGNGSEGGGFVHPVVRAILLHFWLAYDHPFVDGNGRTARALFYWSMLRQGYWLTEFLSISRVMKKAPARYARAFLFAEDGERDATYFVAHQLRVIRNAIDDLTAYLKRKTHELRDVESKLRDRNDLNHRQIAVLARALRHPDEQWTIQQHMRAHGVVYQTARVDLLALAQKGFLVQGKYGQRYVFMVPMDLERRLDVPSIRS